MAMTIPIIPVLIIADAILRQPKYCPRAEGGIGALADSDVCLRASSLGGSSSKGP